MSTTFVNHIMRDKRSISGEISVVLFENCNLRCSFCPQNHTSTRGMNDISEHYELVERAIDQFVLEGKPIISITIHGGELFQDAVDDHLFDQYVELVRIIRAHPGNASAKIGITFCTNLVFTKTERVLNFITEIQSKYDPIDFAISYDPVSRFSRKDLDVFKTNLNIFNKYIDSVNLVFTKPNIKKIIAGDDLFDYLYDNFTCTFDYYQIEPNKKVNAPTDQDLQDIFLLLARKYPKTNPIQGYFIRDRNDAIYQHTKNALENTITGFCDVNFEGKIFAGSNASFQDIELKFLDDMGCLSCPFFERCGLGCIPQHYFYPEYKTLDYCWQKSVHEEIDRLKVV